MNDVVVRCVIGGIRLELFERCWIGGIDCLLSTIIKNYKSLMCKRETQLSSEK
jgi:hypothetical protein